METLHSKVKELQLRAAPVTYTSAPADYKLNTEDRTIKGYLSVFGVRDSFGTVFVRGCFAKSINDRGPQSNSKYKIPLLWQHDMRDPIGRITVLQEDDYGLYFEAEIDDVPNGNRALTQVRSGTINQFSHGFDYIWTDEAIRYDEKTDSFLLSEVILWEGSAVTRGSNHETFAIRSTEDYEQAMQELREDTEALISQIPRKHQYELRQLITRHTSLAKAKPQEETLNALRQAEPITERGVDYQFLINNL